MIIFIFLVESLVIYLNFLKLTLSLYIFTFVFVKFINSNFKNKKKTLTGQPMNSSVCHETRRCDEIFIHISLLFLDGL